jgi:hypothetical protein
MKGSRGDDHMVVESTITNSISAYQYTEINKINFLKNAYLINTFKKDG